MPQKPSVLSLSTSRPVLGHVTTMLAAALSHSKRRAEQQDESSASNRPATKLLLQALDVAEGLPCGRHQHDHASE